MARAAGRLFVQAGPFRRRLHRLLGRNLGDPWGYRMGGTFFSTCHRHAGDKAYIATGVCLVRELLL